MPSFKDLPNEIISEIWSWVLDPKDIQSFAQTARSIYALALPILEEYRRLRDAYTHCEISKKGDGTCVGAIVKDLVINPHHELYIEGLSIRGWRWHWDQEETVVNDPMPSNIGDYRRSIYAPYCPGDMEILRQAAEGAPSLNGESGLRAMREGCEAPLVALLLLKLTRLKHLNIEEISGWANSFCATILDIVNSSIASNGNTKTFSQLSTVTLSNDKSADETPFWLLEALASLPSVKTIHSMNILPEITGILTGGTIPGGNLAYGKSNIQELSMRHCALHPPRFYDFLERTLSLRKFTYTHPNEEVAPFEPFWIRVALLAYASETLQWLEIRHDGHPVSEWSMPPFVGGFRNFSALKHLVTDQALLLGHGPDCPVRFADMLPDGLESLYLYPHQREMIPALVEDLLVARRTRLRSLVCVTLDGELLTMPEEGVESSELMMESCRAVGLALRFVLGVQDGLFVAPEM